jgi:plasmid stability protein
MAKDRPRTGRTRVTLDLGDELTRRLRVHGMQTGRSESALVRELLERHLPRYVVQDRSPKFGKTGTDG